ncbi:MAG: hypothetical protein ACKVOM_12240, partial [Ferruginibacter sp.]
MIQRKSIVSIAVLLLIFVLSRCMNYVNASTDSRGTSFAGAASCRQCHQSIYDSVLQSAHYNASAPVTEKNVRGSVHTAQ